MIRKRRKMTDPLNAFFAVDPPDQDLNDYFVHCYLYYELNCPVIHDHDFDVLCKKILAKWDTISHPHKDIVSKKDLAAGTGYSIKSYPDDVIEEAEKLRAKFLEELQHEVEVAKEIDEQIKEEEQFNFNNTPAETYLLCGLYRDYKYYKDIKRKKIIEEELERRWSSDDNSMIKKYMEDHGITPETLNLKK